MTNYFKILLISTMILMLNSCGTHSNSEINTKPNAQYKKSRKSFSGTLNKIEYDKLVNDLERELNTKIPEGKSILIHYSQKAPNCIDVTFSQEDISNITINVVRISTRISSKNNAISYFVYSENTFHKDYYKQIDNYALDSGYFYNNIFTLHETCSAFFIIKPNGDFLKHYGSDYFTEVSDFLEKE
jgi:hypothetical protein